MHTLDELGARLGKDRLWQPGLHADHRPEYAWCRSDRSVKAPPAPDTIRPLWLLREPRPLQCRSGTVCYNGPLQILKGPERIESGWWDGKEYCRDYYVAVSTGCSRLWIFQDLKSKDAWFLHGLFG